MFVGIQYRLLHGIRNILLILKETAGYPVKGLPVLLHQRDESVGIAALCPSHKHLHFPSSVFTF